MNQHEQNPKEPKADGQWHSEEWQSIVHEEAWKQPKARPYIWGTFVWNLGDFTSYWRHEGGVVGRNDKRLVTYDRGIKKDAFYFYKANWSDEPTFYITSRRFTERINAVSDVKVYSNVQSIGLFLNEVFQDERSNDGNAVFIWKDCQLRSGENTIKAEAQCQGRKLEDVCHVTCLSSLTNNPLKLAGEKHANE